MRNILLLIAIAAIGVTAYLMMGQDEAVETPAAAVTEEAPAEEATTEAEDAVEEAVEEAETAAEAAQEAVDNAATSAQEAVDNAVDQATEAATEAATAVQETGEAAAEAASEAVSSATEAVTEAVTGDTGLADVLTVDGFDFDQAVAMIDGSDMGALQKTTLKTGLEQARDNPELLSQILEQIRETMGL